MVKTTVKGLTQILKISALSVCCMTLNACTQEQEAKFGDALAASKAKDYDRANQLYMEILTDEDATRAVQELIQAARTQDPQAQYRLAEMYLNQNPHFKIDKQQAAYWLKEAAQLGHASAQYELSNMYVTGDGVEKNPLMAYILLKLPKNDGRHETEASRYVADRLDKTAKLLKQKQKEAAELFVKGWRPGEPLPEGFLPKQDYKETAASQQVNQKLKKFQLVFTTQAEKAGKNFEQYLRHGDIPSLQQLAAESKPNAASNYVNQRLDKFQDMFAAKTTQTGKDFEKFLQTGKFSSSDQMKINEKAWKNAKQLAQHWGSALAPLTEQNRQKDIKAFAEQLQQLKSQKVMK